MTDITLRRITTSRGFKVYECWNFSKSYSGECTATHYMTNTKGTYFRRLGTRWFENAEQGNEFFKKIRNEGFTKKTV